MSNQFIDNFKSSFETFESIPGYVNGNTTKRNQSLSVLNKGNKNIHNSIFTDLVPTNKKGFIVKKGTKFPDKLSKINSYFVDIDGNADTMSKCQDVCAKEDYCKAFTFNKDTKKCNTYNGIPNRMIGNANTNSGYKGNLSFDFAKLKPKQKYNIEKRIGSQYLMKRFNIKSPNAIENFENNEVEGYMNNNITKCLSLKQEPDVIVKMKLILKVSNRKYSGSRTVNYIILKNGQDVASNKVSLSKYTLLKDKYYSIPLEFNIKNFKFDGFELNIGSDGIILDQIKLVLIIKNDNIVLYDKVYYNKGIIIKKKPQYFGLDRKIDINKLAVNKIDYYVGSNNTDEEKKINVNNEKIDDILSSNKWSIEFNLKIDPKKIVKRWKNILLYGNNNAHRTPGIWIWPYPNNRRIHFRFRSSRYWNDGFNFYLPNITNEFMNIKIIFINTGSNYTYYVYVNGKRVAKTTKSGYIKPYKNQNMFIKYKYNGRYDTRGYDVDNITFTKEFVPTAILNKAIDTNRKVLGYNADPECIFNKVPETEDVYNRTLEEHDGVQNDSVISESINDQDQYGDKIADYQQQLADINSDSSLNSKLDNNMKTINNLESDNPSAVNEKNSNLLQQKINGKSIIESYTNNINNNSICYIVIILIMLIVLAFLIN
jgi:hypothetical protein